MIKQKRLQTRRIVALAALTATLGAMLLATQPLLAQQGTEPMGQGEQQGDMPLVKRLPERYRLSTWIGKSVQNRNGDELGTVEELVMDDLGRVRYVVMQSQLLTDSKRSDRVAVPVGHFVYPLARKDHLIFDTTPGRMKNAPSFGAAAMPDMGRHEVSSLIIAYWLPEGDSETPGQAQDAKQGQRQTGKGDYDPNRDMINLTPRKTALFNELDQDNDGAISREEAEAHERLSQQFDAVDTYGNEAITRSEFSAFELEQPDADGTRDQTAEQGRHQ